MTTFHHTNQKLICSKCGEIQELFDGNNIEVFVCPSCFQVHHDTKEKYAKLPLNDKKLNPALQLNDEGNYLGRKFKVVGKAKKQDKQLFNTVWTEYVIQFSDNNTFAYINLWQGHWTILFPIKGDALKFDAKNYKASIFCEENYYTFYARYKYETISLVGSFPYDPIDVRNVIAYDYINPPKMLSIEKNGEEEISIFHGKYIYPKEMASIFNKPILAFKDRTGVAPSQPFYGNLSVTHFNRIVMVFLLIFTFIFIFTESAKEDKTLAIIDGKFNSPYEAVLDSTNNDETNNVETLNDPILESLNIDLTEVTQDAATEQTTPTADLPSVESLNKELISNTFTLNDQLIPNNIDIELNCPISNHWMELQIAAVNETSGKEYETAIGVEYYEGVDGGYSWSEGSKNSTIKLTGLTPGKYHLKAKCLTDSNLSFDYRLNVTKGTTGYWNYFFVLISCLVCLAIVNITKSQFEKIRNGENDTLFG